MHKLLILIVLLLLALQPAAAQEILELDQLTSGELTADNPTASYFLALKAGQTLHLQAVVVTNGLILQGVLATATGTVVQNIPNQTNSASLDAEISASANGIFRLDISSANASLGQFVLLVQELETVEPDEELVLDEPVSDTLQPGDTVAYALSGDPTARLILEIVTDDPDTSLDAELLDADGSVIASMETQETGGELLIPTGRKDYQLTLNNPQTTVAGFEVTLTSLDGPISTPVSSPTITATTAVTSQPTQSLFCTVTPNNIAVNVRSGPSVQFGIIGSLPLNATMTAIARNPEGTWYQVQANAQSVGWVALSVVTVTGPCANLQVVFIPTPTPPPATHTPEPIPTEAAAPRCSPDQFRWDMDNGAYMVISLPTGNIGDVIRYRDGYHTEYVFPTCRAMLWSSLSYVCETDGVVAYWALNSWPDLDWNATCGSNTNADQPGMSFGVR